MNLLFITIVSIALLALASPNGYSPIVLKSAIGIPMVTIFFLMWIYSWRGESTLKIKVNSLHTPIVGFFIWASISSLWSVNDFYALTMLMQFLSYVLVFILVYNLLNNIKELKLVVFSFVIIGAVVSTIGLLQYYLINNVFIQNLFTQGAWPASTFGNKNFAMHFIVMVIPIALVSTLKTTSVKQAWVLSFLLFINLWYWMFSFTRAAWLAVFLQIIFLIIFMIIDKFKNNQESILSNLKFLRIKLIALFIVIASLIAISFVDFDKDRSIKNRIQSINYEFENPRIPAWLNTIEMIKDRPFVGVGIGQWPVFYPLYHDKAMPDIIFNEDTELDHLHNEYLEMFANFGLVGYIFLLWIMAISMQMMIRLLTLKFDKYKIYTLIVTLPLLGFLVESFFSFPIKAYYPMLFVMVLLAVLSYLYDFIYLKNTPRFYMVDICSTRTKSFLFYVLTISLLLSVLFFSYYSFNWVMAEKYREHAYEFERNQHFNLTKVASLKSQAHLSNFPDLHNLLGLSYLKSDDDQNAINTLERGLALQPYQSNALFNLSLAYRKAQNYEKELEVLHKLVKINLNHFRAHAAITRIYYVLNEISKAEIAYKNMKLYFFQQKNRSGFSPHYDVVGKTAILVKDFEFAKLVYTEYLQKEPSAENFKVLGTLYLYNTDKIQDRAKGVGLFIKSLKLNPKIDDRKVMIKEIRNFKLESFQ